MKIEGVGRAAITILSIGVHISLLVAALTVTVRQVLRHTSESSVAHHTFQHGEQIPLYVDTVASEDNPGELYPYYGRLPFCPPPTPPLSSSNHFMQDPSETIGEVLQGSRRRVSRYNISFGVDVPQRTVVCNRTLTADQKLLWRDAIMQRFHFTMHFDGMPFRGYIGKLNSADGKVYFGTSIKFLFYHHDDRVISVQFDYDQDVWHKFDEADKADDVVQFFYKVEWRETNKTEREPFSPYAEEGIPEEWDLLLVVPFIMVMIFVGWHLQGGTENGTAEWTNSVSSCKSPNTCAHEKNMPTNTSSMFFLCAVVGCGLHLWIVCITMIALSGLGAFDEDIQRRVAVHWIGLCLYSSSAFIAGHASGMLYHALGEGTDWKRNGMITAMAFSGPVLVILALLYVLAWTYGTTTAYPFSVVAVVFIVLIPGTLATTLGGAILANKSRFVARTTIFDQPRRWSKQETWVQPVIACLVLPGLSLVCALAGGFRIRFSLHALFNSTWHWEWSRLLSVSEFLLLSMTFCVVFIWITVVGVLENGDSWNSPFTFGAFTAIFTSCYYLGDLNDPQNNFNMHGLYQWGFVCGYLSILCYGMALMIGGVGFLSSLVFVECRRVVRGLK